MQHLVAHTSSSEGLNDNIGWYQNAAGFVYNHRFGFGLLNAKALTEAAETYKNVGKQEKCTISNRIQTPQLEVQAREALEIPIFVQCSDVRYIEHTLVTISIEAPIRGQLEIAIRSPQGDYSQLLTKREEDESTKGFKDWTFNTVHFWGTDPNGEFVIYVNNQVRIFKLN